MTRHAPMLRSRDTSEGMSSIQGLTRTDALARLQQEGLNEIPEEKFVKRALMGFRV